MSPKALARTVLPLLLVVVVGRGSRAQPSPPFVFHNNFWVNLHQTLYAEAGRAGGSRRAGGSDGSGRSGGSGGDEATWQSALDAYADLAKRDLIFDAKLVAINDALGRIATEADVTDTAIEPGVRAALNQAAPIYRLRGWPRQRQTNDAWIADMKQRVDRHGAALVRALAHAYRTDWPSKPILIDVSGEAGVYGGYTTNDGPAGFAAHSTIAPGGKGAEGDMGLETIFHEASHAVDASIMRMINAECAVQKVRAPRNLWHALIFYTTGELVRRQVGMAGDEHYMPYAYRFDVYSKGMEKDRAALEQDWQPFLDGTVPFEEALRNLVRDATR